MEPQPGEVWTDYLDGLLVDHVDVKSQVLETFDQASPGTLHRHSPEDVLHQGRVFYSCTAMKIIHQ